MQILASWEPVVNTLLNGFICNSTHLCSLHTCNLYVHVHGSSHAYKDEHRCTFIKYTSSITVLCDSSVPSVAVGVGVGIGLGVPVVVFVVTIAILAYWLFNRHRKSISGMGHCTGYAYTL